MVPSLACFFYKYPVPSGIVSFFKPYWLDLACFNDNGNTDAGGKLYGFDKEDHAVRVSDGNQVESRGNYSVKRMVAVS